MSVNTHFVINDADECFLRTNNVQRGPATNGIHMSCVINKKYLLISNVWAACLRHELGAEWEHSYGVKKYFPHRYW
jgi:hypothetical protein